MTDVKELLAKANKQCKRIKDFIIENEGMFDSMDLKLHDASFYEYRDMENDFPLCYADNEHCAEDSYFYRFCESTYDQFTDWCAEKKIDFRGMCHHIGRTSQFYLYEKELIQRDNRGINWAWTMENIFNELGYTNYYQLLEFDEDGNVDEEKSFSFQSEYFTREEWIDELKPALQYIVDEMYNDFMKEIEDVKEAYDYIKDTKDNQIEYFKEYLEWNEEDLQNEKDKADIEKAKRNEIIAKMPERIRSIMNRSALDSEDLTVVLGCMA